MLLAAAGSLQHYYNAISAKRAISNNDVITLVVPQEIKWRVLRRSANIEFIHRPEVSFRSTQIITPPGSIHSY